MTNKLLKLILAFAALLVSMPAIYLPWRIRRIYLKSLVLFLYKFVQFGSIADHIVTHKQKLNSGEKY